jgi:hypothetical protein
MVMPIHEDGDEKSLKRNHNDCISDVSLKAFSLDTTHKHFKTLSNTPATQNFSQTTIPY